MRIAKPKKSAGEIKDNKRFGSRKELAKRFANFRNPFEYYRYQKLHLDIPEQTPIVPVGQRKVKVVKNEVK